MDAKTSSGYAPVGKIAKPAIAATAKAAKASDIKTIKTKISVKVKKGS